MTADRKYLRSHPWLSFELDLRRAPVQLWMLLGEAVSMCEQIAHAPVRPAASQEMHRIYFAKGVLATTAIEGNTLSEEQVRAQIDGRLKVPPSKAYLQQEVQNVIQACQLIWQDVINGHATPLSAALIKDFNRTVLNGLDGHLEDGVTPGEIPTHSVVVGNVYRGAPREDCEFLLARLAQWLEGMGPRLLPDWEHPTEVPLAILKAVAAHLYIAWIHPFGDGNGRTARLIEFFVLARAGVPTPVAHLLSNHYNETRAEYYRQLDRASKSGGDVFPFFLYAVQGFVDGLQAQLNLIRREHLSAAWESYVYERFRAERRSEAATRQRDLVLALSAQPDVVPINALRSLTPNLAERYAGKTTKTITRDLGVLKKLGLVRMDGRGYGARTDIMLGFLPWSSLPTLGGGSAKKRERKAPR